MKAYVRLIIVMAVTSLISLGVYIGGEASWGKLSRIDIELDPESDQVQVFSRIQDKLNSPLKKYEGQWVWRVSLKDVLAQVEDDRRVKSASVTRLLPNRLKISIVPHQPILAWVDEIGKLYPIAADASLLPAVSLKDSRDVPLLRGRDFYNDEALRERAIELLKSLPEDGALSPSRISEITHSPQIGFNLLLTQGGIEVRMGEDDFARKAKRVEQVLNYLLDQQLKGRVIDARFAKKVVVRLRNAP